MCIVVKQLKQMEVCVFGEGIPELPGAPPALGGLVTVLLSIFLLAGTSGDGLGREVSFSVFPSFGPQF